MMRKAKCVLRLAAAMFACCLALQAKPASAYVGAMFAGPMGLMMIASGNAMILTACFAPPAAVGLIAGAWGLGDKDDVVREDLAQTDLRADLAAKVRDGIYTEQEGRRILQDLKKVSHGARIDIDTRDGRDSVVDSLTRGFRIHEETAEYLASLYGL